MEAGSHRNYGYSGDYIRVSIFDDRMEIQSPGKLPNLVTLENLRHTRWSRNPVIARTLVELVWVRELNEGVERIYEDMDAYLLNPPTFSEPNNASVMLTLENSISSRMLWRGGSLEEVVGVDALETLNEYEIAAVQLAMAHGRVTTKGLAERTGKGSKLFTRTLRGLVDKQILVWHGTAPNDPSQHYTLVK
ncbi:ATP-binding protein [Adlercreutzia sp. ZJ141]|uniref:ATP-binding protein n=1 Tax=Adlercreutzia sp. ZJ141 TaxID=2709406 RepID=UPI00353047CC